MSGADRDAEIRALLVLEQLPGVGPITVKRVVDAAGTAVAALRGGRALDRYAGAGMLSIARDRAFAARVERALADAAHHRMHVTTWTDPDYPPRLHQLKDPPPVLFLRGRKELLATPGVAIVGARRATAHSRDVSRRLGEAVARAGAAVVSGLALGVDGAAHRGALDAEGETVAVLGCGADRAYPSSHHRLFGEIVSKGLVVSEFMPRERALPAHFPRRNRVLAALSRKIVVVEATRSSGARHTVDHALDLGLEVWAVPGPIDQPTCAGSNDMLRNGATPVWSIEDFVHDLTGAEAPVTARGPRPALAGEQFVMFDALGDGCHHAGELATRVALPIPRVLALLAALEVRGVVEQLPGMRFRRAS